MFGKNKNDKRAKGEAAVTTDLAEAESAEKREGRKSIIKTIGGVLDTVNVAVPKVTDFYNNWVKPVWTNRATIKRRLNTIVTIVSLIFFVIYVPLLLFGKIADGLGLGWQIALYVCVGIYFVMLVALLIVTLVSGKVNSTEMAKRRKLIYRIIMLVVRLVSVAVAITALIISSNAESSALNTLAMVVAILSIIFSVLPLIFGGFLGFFRWLISPASASVKRTFSFVALEWNQMFEDTEQTSKTIKKAFKKHSNKLESCLDKYILPQLGQKLIKSVGQADISAALSSVPQDDINITEWAIKSIFAYAENSGYIDDNPCEDLALTGDIELESKKNRVK